MGNHTQTVWLFLGECWMIIRMMWRQTINSLRVSVSIFYKALQLIWKITFAIYLVLHILSFQTHNKSLQMKKCVPPYYHQFYTHSNIFLTEMKIFDLILRPAFIMPVCRRDVLWYSMSQRPSVCLSVHSGFSVFISFRWDEMLRRDEMIIWDVEVIYCDGLTSWVEILRWDNQMIWDVELRWDVQMIWDIELRLLRWGVEMMRWGIDMCWKEMLKWDDEMRYCNEFRLYEMLKWYEKLCNLSLTTRV